MNKKIIFLACLLSIVNFEWIFIGINSDQIFAINNLRNKGLNIQKEKSFIERFDYEEKNWLNREEVVIDFNNVTFINIISPSIDLNSQIINSNTDIEEKLDEWVVRIVDKEKEGIFLFGHSSSEKLTPYSYIFTRILDLKKWNIIWLETQEFLLIYKVTDNYIKDIDEMKELWWSKKVFLITCYPLNTTLKRYIVEWEIFKIIKKVSIETS